MVLNLKNGKVCFDEQLLLYIKQKNSKKLRSFLSKKDLCKTSDDTGATLLHYASDYGNAEVTQYLLDSGADVNAEDLFQRTPLLLAVTRKESEISSKTIKILLSAKADILKADVFSDYPLRRVVDNRDFSKLRVVKDFFERLREYCKNDTTMMADLLIEASCPLERVMYLGNAKVTEILISNGSDVDARHPHSGRTALHVAVALMDELNIKMLIKYGADATIKLDDRHLPLSLYLVAALRYPQMRNPEIMKTLMKPYFAAPGKTTDTELTFQNILHFGDEEDIRYALQYDVDLSMKNTDGNGVLHFLAMNRNINVAKPFEGKIIDVNVRNQRGRTPLHYAVSVRNIDTMKFLLDTGADVNAKTNRGNTALASLLMDTPGTPSGREKQLVELLLYHGADIPMEIPEKQKIILDLLASAQRFNLREFGKALGDIDSATE